MKLRLFTIFGGNAVNNFYVPNCKLLMRIGFFDELGGNYEASQG